MIKFLSLQIKHIESQFIEIWKELILKESRKKQREILQKSNNRYSKYLDNLINGQSSFYECISLYNRLNYGILYSIADGFSKFKLDINIRQILQKIILEGELEAHYEELSEIIYKTDRNKKKVTVKVYKLLIWDMFIQRLYEEKVWYPYISKIWIFVETQIMGTFTRF